MFFNIRLFTQTDILYHGCDLDTLFRNVTNNTTVKYCWVPELGNYILENLSLHFDELLIDELNSNLRSLYIKYKIVNLMKEVIIL
jgi:hypothetical protein